MKFYLDENLTPKIAVTLRKKRVDVVSAHEVGAIQWSDRDQLKYAGKESRCLVTRNARHFIELAHDAIQHQAPHAGILLLSARFTGAEIRIVVDGLSRVAKQYPKGLGPYDIFYL